MRRYKEYKPGDLITVSVPKGFEEVATEFFRYCGEYHYNPSEVIRALMYDWLSRKRGRKPMENQDLEKRILDIIMEE